MHRYTHLLNTFPIPSPLFFFFSVIHMQVSFCTFLLFCTNLHLWSHCSGIHTLLSNPLTLPPPLTFLWPIHVFLCFVILFVFTVYTPSLSSSSHQHTDLTVCVRLWNKMLAMKTTPLNFQSRGNDLACIPSLFPSTNVFNQKPMLNVESPHSRSAVKPSKWCVLKTAAKNWNLTRILCVVSLCNLSSMIFLFYFF